VSKNCVRYNTYPVQRTAYPVSHKRSIVNTNKTVNVAKYNVTEARSNLCTLHHTRMAILAHPLGSHFFFYANELGFLQSCG
jgi:hypothetical protein